MFKEEIHIKKKNDIRYGTTKIKPSKTQAEIMELLDEHDCSKIGVWQEGKKKVIGFEYQDKTYTITVPRVYVRGTYKKNIGIRLVKYYLEIMLDWAKERVIDFDFMMLPNRVVNYKGQQYRFGDLTDKLPDGQLMSPLSDADQLPDDKDSDIRDTEYEQV